MNKILVTGGNGFIGSMVCKSLYDSGYEVDSLDNLDLSFPRKHTIEKNIKIIKCDLTDRKRLKEILQKNKYDGVFHLAGLISVSDSNKQQSNYFKNNVLASLNLILTMIETDTNNLIFSSSASVYQSKSSKIIETDFLNPISVYAQNKFVVENFLKSMFEIYNFKSITLRYFNACGADFESLIGFTLSKETHLIPLAISATLSNNIFNLYGNNYDTKDGTCMRDYVHIKDIAEAHIEAFEGLRSNKINYDVFNIGTGKGYTVLEIIEKIQIATNRNLNYIISDRREGDASCLVADVNKFSKTFDWKATKTLNDIIKDSIFYYKKVY